MYLVSTCQYYDGCIGRVTESVEDFVAIFNEDDPEFLEELGLFGCRAFTLSRHEYKEKSNGNIEVTLKYIDPLGDLEYTTVFLLKVSVLM